MWVLPVIAIAVILLAVRLAGARGVPRFAATEEVRALLATERPELEPRAIDLATDGRAALVDAGADDVVAVAFVLGNQQSTRELRRGDIAAVESHATDGGHAVTIHTHDLGFPRLHVRLDATSWHRWEPRLRGLVGALAAMIGATAVGAQGGACGAVQLSPAVPTPGHFFRVRLTSPVGRLVGAEAFGEPLHVEADSLGAVTALAGAPIDAVEGRVVVTCEVGGAQATTTVQVSLARASYPVERLRVDPRFVDPPDSALAARIARESARAGAVARAAHVTPRLWRDAFRPPRASRVTSRYGRARMFNGAVQSRHLGTDDAGAVGAPVRATNRGVVRIVDAFYYGGRVVYIDHGAGLTTAYLHLSRHRVAEGDTVARGQVIGEVGATGRVTGPHLHLIARYGGHSLDALSLLRLTAPAAPSR